MSSHLAVTSDVVADSAPSRILKLHQGHGSRCSEPDTFTARDKIKEVMPKRKSLKVLASSTIRSVVERGPKWPNSNETILLRCKEHRARTLVHGRGIGQGTRASWPAVS
jgi:hypothetical protein